MQRHGCRLSCEADGPCIGLNMLERCTAHYLAHQAHMPCPNCTCLPQHPARADPPAPAAGGRWLKLDCPALSSCLRERSASQRLAYISTAVRSGSRRPRAGGQPLQARWRWLDRASRHFWHSKKGRHSGWQRRTALPPPPPRTSLPLTAAAAHCTHGLCTFHLLPWGYAAVAIHSSIRALFADWPALLPHRRHWRAPPLPRGVGTEPCRLAWRPCWPLSPHLCC